MITEEQKERAIRLYKDKELTLATISNLTDISISKLSIIFREAFNESKLKPRFPEKALIPRTPKGQGKKKEPSGIGKGGRNKERKKFSEEQEREIAQDYYERGLTLGQVTKKWGIHPVQMQRIRNKFGTTNKMDKRIRAVEQLDKNGKLLERFDNGNQASKQTGISYQTIYKCCTGMLKTAGGFIWRFEAKEMKSE